MNYTDSARNQQLADVVEPLDEIARPLAQYADGSFAGLAASTCLPYRVAYLAFGLEGAGPSSARRQTMQAVLDWLMAAPPVHAFSLSSDPGIAVGLPGTVVTHEVSLRNIGQQSDTYTVTLRDNRWPMSLVVSTTNQPLPTYSVFRPAAARASACKRLSRRLRRAISPIRQR